VKKHATRSAIAVAFFSKNAARQLPLERGSLLVVNASDQTLAAGLTNPFELEKLLHKGVEIYANARLHAKVFVFPGRAVVGSNNASHSSAQELLEAAIEVTARGTVGACRKYVKSLCQGPPLGQEYLDALKQRYRPAPLPKPNSGPDPALRLWAVCVEPVEYDRFDRLAETRGMPLAEAELSSTPPPPEPVRVERFWTSTGVFRREVALHDIVSQLYTKNGTRVVDPPSRVIHLEHYTKEDGTECVMVFLEAFERREPIALDTVIWRLQAQRNCQKNALALRSIRTAKRIVDQHLREEFSNLWV
jgi:hypothetical protein